MVRSNVLKAVVCAAVVACLGVAICAAPASASRSLPSLSELVSAPAEAPSESSTEAPAESSTDASAVEAAPNDGSIDALLDSMTLDELIALRDDVDARIAKLRGTGSQGSASGAADAGATGAAAATYEFDGFELAVSDNLTLETSRKGVQYVRVPITVTNNTGSTGSINMFYVSYYGSKGTSLDVPYFYFDDELAGGDKMRSGASMELAAYLEYDGNGDYYIELNKPWSETVEIHVSVNL